MWRIEYTDIAERAILKLDKPVRIRILAFMRERIGTAEDAKKIGRATHR